ncbi:protein kinase domain-containing protein [Lachnoanaerobaculum gingivalis]|uniref:protein kinase domain-containing protein n=1 Tax=Lachnoanaerobaculum gingivalis TaxID=2490855 RepID=UPI0028D29B2D|nr:protein kinase [Lachnoanaerobaculum gingivalis]
MEYRDIIQSVWPDWQAKEILGKGSYGTVFRAVKEKLGVGKESAIKVVHIPTDDNQIEQIRKSFHLSDKELKEYFYPEVEKLKEEVALMEKLGENEHCLHIQDFDILEEPEGSIGWNILIRMELLESLESRISRGGITLGEVVSLGENILSALETCESHRIIHRDIKPANIFVNSRGVYKLGDFGIAKDLTLESRNLSHRGTDNYAAPEVCQGRDYSYNVDIYALGLVLYQLLNKNKRPFFGEGKITSTISEEAYRKRITGEVFPNPTFGDEELFAVIRKMCAFDPKERFQSAGEAKSALQAYREKHKDKLDVVLELGQKKSSDVCDVQSAEYMDKNPKEGYVRNTPKTGNKLERQSSFTGSREEVFTESNHYDEVNSSEDYTRSLNYYGGESQARGKEKYVSQAEEVDNKQPDLQQILEEANQLPSKKKSRLPLIFVSIIFCLILVVGGIFFSNFLKSQEELKENTVRVAKAKEIAATSDLFEIDKDSLNSDVYIDYTISIMDPISNGLSDATGIYIGELKQGIPEGYGVFYYKVAENDNGLNSRMLLGEWEKGNLKSKTVVEFRYIYHVENNDGTGELIKYLFKDEWKDYWFTHDEAEGVCYNRTISKNEYVKSDEKLYKTEWTFTGTVGAKFRECIRGIKKYSDGEYAEGEFNKDNFVKGKLHRSDGTLYDGEFRNGLFYNGTAYEADGSVKFKMINGRKLD